MKNGISAYLVVYHEEKVIERCLKSLVGVVNEIIVIHDGPCLDKTMEIAKKYTNHVFEKEHKGISELHRIDILQKCHFPWVIQMDADEFLSEELKEKLPTLIKGKEIDAYAFLWKVWNGKKYLTKNFPFKTILFRKEKMGYITFPGRDPFTYGKKKNESLILEHQPNYNNYTIDVFQKKWYPWIKVHADFLVKENFSSFQVSQKDLQIFFSRQRSILQLAHPLLAPLWFLYSCGKSFSNGFYKNPNVWHLPVLQGMYGFCLCLEIWKRKR